jgi:hypothetical protein
MYEVERREKNKPVYVTRMGAEAFNLVPVYPEDLFLGGGKIRPIPVSESSYRIQFLPTTIPKVKLREFFGKELTYGDYVGAVEKDLLQRHSKCCIAQAISDIKPSGLAVEDLDLGIDSEFVFTYSMMHYPFSKAKGGQLPVKCHAFGLFSKFEGMSEDGSIDSTTFMATISQILRTESKYACIFLEYGGHISVLAVDLDDRSMLYSFDSMGIAPGSHAPTLSHLSVKSLNAERIQPPSGCGYIAMKFATTLIKEQDMGKAVEQATGLGKFLMVEKNPLKVQETLSKEFGVEKELSQIMTEKDSTSKGKKGGHGDYLDLTGGEEPASFVSEEDVLCDVKTREGAIDGIGNKGDLKKTFLEREKLRRSKKPHSAGILFAGGLPTVKPSVLEKSKRSNSVPPKKTMIELS